MRSSFCLVAASWRHEAVRDIPDEPVVGSESRLLACLPALIGVNIDCARRYKCDNKRTQEEK